MTRSKGVYMRARLILPSMLAIALLGRGARGDARTFIYFGSHPLAAGYCDIEASHGHPFAPPRPALYEQVGGQFVFTGDPTPFGYSGPHYTYYGHHPVVTMQSEDPVYCYLNGPHYHPYSPPIRSGFRMEGDVAFYVGPFSPVYANARDRRARAVTGEYLPFDGLRPRVEVRPPPEWRGAVYTYAPGAARSVVVAPPAPRVLVSTPPRVVVTQPSVYLQAPQLIFTPPSGVVVAAPRTVIVRDKRWKRHPRDDDDDHDHGDGHRQRGRGEREHHHDDD